MKKKNVVFVGAFWIMVWQVVSFLIGNDIFLPSPFTVVGNLCALSMEGIFWKSIAITFLKIGSGLLIAIVVGMLLAIFASKWNVVKQLLAPLMIVFRAVPVASFIILVLIWFSSGNLSIFISFLMALPIIYTNILRGIEEADKELLEMSRFFGRYHKKSLAHVYFFELYPYFQTAMSVAIGLCFKAGIAAEVIGLPKESVGEQLYQSKIYLETGDLFAWTVVVVVLSVIVEKLMVKGLKFAKKYLER